VALISAAGSAQGQTFRDATATLPDQQVQLAALGASAVDVNADGWVDIFRASALYLNRGEAGFEHFYDEAGLLDDEHGVFGGIFGDYTGDGFPDLFIEDLVAPAQLYRNRGDGTFVLANAESGVNTTGLFVQGSLWADLTNDGLLDLFIGNDSGENKLYVNFDGVAMQDASHRSNIAYERNTYGVAASDYDRDGDLDVFIAACHTGTPSRSINLLLRNSGGQFADVAFQAGVADTSGSWGVVWLDYDNDGWQDVFIANHGTNRLYRNTGQGTFDNVSDAAGVGGAAFGYHYSAAAADFDNDGWIDLFVGAHTGESDQLYRNLGDGTFEQITSETGITVDEGGAMAVADFNNDGWIDLFAIKGDDRLFLNEGGTNHWLKVRTRGTFDNHFGIGARVELHTPSGLQIREITAGDGMTSQNHDLSAHFGLGAVTTIDSIVVRWPGGLATLLYGVGVDQEITIVEGVGINQPPPQFGLIGPPSGSVFSSVDGPDEIEFAWGGSSDPEGGALTYTLHITGQDVDLEYAGLTATTFALAPAGLPVNIPLTWTVAATDGYSVRGSTDRFGLEVRTNVAVEEVDDPATDIILSTYPNPFRDEMTVRISLPQPGYASATIFDTVGRQIRVLAEGLMPSGTHDFNWDSRDHAGQRVATGLYIVHVKSDHAAAAATVVRI
jgi:hypothetical protein